MASKRVNVKAILADADLRRQLMISTIQATQAREGIDTSPEQAGRAYYVVTESERAAFFDLHRFRAGKGISDRRHEMFVRALGLTTESIRFDVARRDFSGIDSAPLAYRRVGLVSHVFRDNLPLEPGIARARRGGYTGDDPRYVRRWWEPGASAGPFEWKPFAKGGGYCRFYSNIDLVVHWDSQRRTFPEFFGRKGRDTARPESLDDYFKPGLTWPLRTQRGFNLRVLPAGCVFGHKGPAVFPNVAGDTFYVLGVANSHMAEYLLQGLTSFGSWEVGVIKRLPIPRTSTSRHQLISTYAQLIHDEKAAWDEGNETSTRFVQPWIVRALDKTPAVTIGVALDRLARDEAEREALIQNRYSELNNEVFQAYGILKPTRDEIEATLGERPPEILWPQMEGKTIEQKRLEHVWRLLSYAVKRVIEGDDDGIVPFSQATGETRLADRVRMELATLFQGRDESQLEVELVNELKRSVKGYRKCNSLDEWLADAYFEHHAALYEGRPIFWHIASAQGTAPFAFGALVHYHRFDKNRMAKLRASYMRDTIEELRREAGLADKAGRTDDRMELQARVEEAQSLDKKLQQIQEGHHEGPDGGDRDFRILTPWKEPSARPQGWNPDLDDGVKVNIAPLEQAGVLRVTGAVG